MDTQPTPADERSLRDVAAWLTTPAQCGVFLSAHDLRRIGSSIGIHVTPLNRRFAVEQLFRSAAIDQTLNVLLTALIAEVRAQISAYELCDIAQLQPWVERAGQTVVELQEMRQIGQSAESS